MSFTVLYLLFSGAVWGQEVGSPPPPVIEEALESEENTPSDEALSQTTESSEEPVVAPSAEPSMEVEVVLVNGIKLLGNAPISEVIAWSPGTPIHLSPEGSEMLLLAGDRIRSIGQPSAEPKTVIIEQASATPAAPDVDPKWADYKSPEGFAFPNPAASRYIYAPSSIPMKKGQGYVSQKLVFTSVAYAMSDNFTALLGTFTFFPPILTIAGGKYGVQVNENLHLGIGGEAFMIPYESTLAAGVVFGSATVGNSDKHLTVATGIAGGDPDFLLEDPAIPVMIGGHARLTDRTAFVTENWLVLDTAALANPSGPIPLGLAVAGSAVVRIIGQRDTTIRRRASTVTKEGYPRTTWDIGLIYLGVRESSRICRSNGNCDEIRYRGEPYGPFPWVDYTWHFGPSG